MLRSGKHVRIADGAAVVDGTGVTEGKSVHPQYGLAVHRELKVLGIQDGSVRISRRGRPSKGPIARKEMSAGMSRAESPTALVYRPGKLSYRGLPQGTNVTADGIGDFELVVPAAIS